MGRELKRKQKKKYEGSVKENEEVNLFTVSGLIRTFAGIVIVLFLSYLILGFFVTKELSFKKSSKSTSSSSSDTSSVSNQILASNIFAQQEDSYYVYFYDFNNEDEKIKDYISGINETVYRVNTASGFNSKYVTSDKGNSSAKSLSDLKVKNPTLIKVSNDSIISYFEGVNSIIDGLD